MGLSFFNTVVSHESNIMMKQGCIGGNLQPLAGRELAQKSIHINLGKTVFD